MDRGYGPNTASVLLVSLVVLLGLAIAWFATRRRVTDDTRGVQDSWRRWLAKLGLAWAAIWLVYQFQIFVWPLPSGPDGPPGYEVFLFFVQRDGSQANFLFDIDTYCEGGVYESVLPAAALGGLLWAAAGAVGWRVPGWRRVATASFVVVYATSLVVLYVVASSVWGMEDCATD
jgi:hypothetical protein